MNTFAKKALYWFGPRLPTEVLTIIFSYLDEKSLYSAAIVCQRWRDIASASLTISWKLFTRRRWPFFRPAVPVSDWFATYSKLVESSFCYTCLFERPKPVPVRKRRGLERRVRFELRQNAYCNEFNIRRRGFSRHLQAVIPGPADSPYEGGTFYISMELSSHHPFIPLKVRFVTKIFHPNISRHGDIGVDMLRPNVWSPAITFDKVLLSIQSLLTDPYTDVCMEPEIGELYVKRRELFDAIARKWTHEYAMCT